MPESMTPVAIMNEVADEEYYLWKLLWTEECGGIARIIRDGKDVCSAHCSKADAQDKFTELAGESGMRAALRALSNCFQDKVVKNAILAAASEGEQE